METVQFDLMETLKREISSRHERMESLPYIQALMNGTLPLQCYVAQLRALAVVHEALDQALDQAHYNFAAGYRQSRPSRLAQLRHDLSGFEHHYVPDCLDALEQARIIAEQVSRLRLEQPDSLFGILYVLEGTTLGNLVHHQDVINAFGEPATGSTSYYEGYGDRTGECWQEFRLLMNSLRLDEDARECVVEAAHWLFEHLETLLRALYPIREEGWGFRARRLNPDAGDHAIPSDPLEIEAALTAAVRCREEYPYFAERYGERGKNFGKSDVAWLVTLCELPFTRLMDQVEWLGRVLANRGMPRITLERQLELLHEALAAARPERREQYAGLAAAAARLRSQRLELIPADRFAELVLEFNRAIGEEMKGRLDRTAELIVSAVCDEEEGIPEAVSSLLSWLADRERFPAPWVSRVLKTVEAARANLPGTTASVRSQGPA